MDIEQAYSNDYALIQNFHYSKAMYSKLMLHIYMKFELIIP